jgi:L-asparaginase
VSRPRVAVGSLGGTITMTSSAPGRGVVPSLRAEDLVAAVPALAEVADLAVHTLRTDPGAWLRPPDLLEVVRWAQARAEDGQGVVIVQGTDTIEESSALLDLHWGRREPLVVTGAMRHPAAPGADGPANLLGAVVVASSPSARDLGVLVVLDDDVHAASRVRKADSSSTGAFSSAPFGVLGRLHEGALTLASRPRPWPALPSPLPGRDPRVALLEVSIGDDGDLLQAVAAGGWDGVVLSAFGAGHVSRRMADVVAEVAPRLPVVLATRTGSGPVLRRTYDFVGSEQDLVRRGAIPGGWTDARKARLLLWSLLAAELPRQALTTIVVERGEAPGGPR